jgi:hypothetical protein
MAQYLVALHQPLLDESTVLRQDIERVFCAYYFHLNSNMPVVTASIYNIEIRPRTINTTWLFLRKATVPLLI